MNIVSIISMIFNALVKPAQKISIQELPKGRILDIGGGGEGVIARVGGKRIFPIDKFRSEIREAKSKAPDNPWVTANAVELPYKNKCFNHATVFYSFMYMSEEVITQVLHEASRVITEGGELLIWDAEILPDNKVFAVRVVVEIPDILTIRTVYGVKAKQQSETTICNLLKEAGFDAEVIEGTKHSFFIRATNG